MSLLATLQLRVRRRLQSTPGHDQGFALITVIGIGFVMTSLMLASLAYAAQVSPQARRDQDWNAALSAAQAGVDDYVSRLNQKDSYALSVDCSNKAMQGSDAPANTCSWNTGPTTVLGWQPVKVSDPSKGSFHYTPTYQAGSVRLTVTGKVRSSYRTLDVRVARGGSTDFLYYTDFEDADPMNKVAYPNGASTNCGGSGKDSAKYWYEPASGSTPPSPTSTYNRRSCQEIQFASGDVLNGKVHMNDTPLIGANSYTSQATFLQGYETSDPNCKDTTKSTVKGYCYRITSAGSPDTGSAGAIYAAPKDLPDNSDEFNSYPGCVYYGDTRIRFNDDGTMTVWNTTSAGKSLTGPNTPTSISCGDASKMKPTSASDPRPSSSVKQTIPVPNDNVIYVRNTGSSETCAAGQVVNGTTSGSTSGDVIPQGTGSDEQGITDVNYWWPGTRNVQSTQSYTVKRSGSTYYWASNGSGSSTSTTADSSHYTTFDCGQGNVYVEGTLKGRVTIAAENNVIITGDLLLAGTSAGADPTGNNVMGLVASNSVVVYHPVTRTSPYYSTTSSSASSTQQWSYPCDNGVGNPPSRSPGKNTDDVTCTWTQVQDIKGGSLDDLAYPNQNTSGSHRWVYASIQTLQHSFWVQTYNQGDTLGKLSVRGSIAQRWRGAVGTGSGSDSTTGYLKDYKYDSRLKYSSPPYFPQWTNATWSAATTGELKPQYVGQ